MKLNMFDMSNQQHNTDENTIQQCAKPSHTYLF